MRERNARSGEKLRLFGLYIVFVFLVCLPLVLAAQEPQQSGPATPVPVKSMTLSVGHGELLQFTSEASRVAVSDPAIADAIVVSAHDVVLNGKTPGNTTIMIWHGDNVSPYNVTVEPDLTELEKQLHATFPIERIGVSSNKDSILLTGVVTDVEVVKKAVAIAGVYAKSVVSLLQSPPEEKRQVMLQVKFASIDRDNLTQLGANLFSLNNKLIGTATTEQFSFPRLGPLQLTPGANGQQVLSNQSVSISDALNLFLFRPDINIGATLKLLQNKNLLEILAEPNLVTMSGHEASFLSGGEFPYPVVTTTGSGGQTAPVVTIQFRPFGVKLTFTPIVESNGLIHLKVQPEVSQLDYANALTIQGFLIPAISTRKAETEVDLHENESFAIAGLIDNRVTKTVSKVPGFGDLPILGHLFSSKSTEKTNTELIVLVTPTFVKPFAPGQTPALPQMPEDFIGVPPAGQTSTPPAGSPAFVGPLGHVAPSGGKP
jgi:pilus assembly protein CpaC